MIASRYGAVPIVRSVGGLKDTIKDFSKKGNGYTFSGDSEALYKVIKKAFEQITFGRVFKLPLIQ